uniref:Uncharacterized protein n=1 Tax=Cynoglossus semilaevis TaxID=244447 RepID=A0A3P8V2M8_CYNSE
MSILSLTRRIPLSLDISSCFSLSRGFCSTISTFFLPSTLLCTFRAKLSVGFSL